MDGLMENPIKMDDLGVPLFLETSISVNNMYVKKSLKIVCAWCNNTHVSSCIYINTNLNEYNYNSQ